MANVLHWGPYFLTPPGGMPVGGAYNISWGPDERFADCSANVSGHAGQQPRRNTMYAVWVSDMSLASTDIGFGDISNVQHTLYATFGNSGQDTVNIITAYVTITKP